MPSNSLPIIDILWPFQQQPKKKFLLQFSAVLKKEFRAPRDPLLVAFKYRSASIWSYGKKNFIRRKSFKLKTDFSAIRQYVKNLFNFIFYTVQCFFHRSKNCNILNSFIYPRTMFHRSLSKPIHAVLLRYV